MYENMNQNELYHFGVKGMKWGVHKQRRQAKKDAKEYARAKMFYGEGAGTRRKLINNTVKQRSKEHEYKKAFDQALAKQDMANHAAKARSERKRKDAANTAGKTGRGIINIVTGHPERLGATMAGAYAAYSIAHKTGVDKVVAKAAKTKFNDIRNSAERMRQVYKAQRKFREWGI